jgi:hypothetical protein
MKRFNLLFVAIGSTGRPKGQERIQSRRRILSKIRPDIILFFILFCFFVNYPVSTQDLDLPSSNPEVITYFFNEAFSLLNYMEMKKDGSAKVTGTKSQNYLPRFRKPSLYEVCQV